MKDRVVGRIYAVSSVHIASQQKARLAFAQQLSLVCRGVTAQHLQQHMPFQVVTQY